MIPISNNIISNLEIVDIAEDGRSIGRHENVVVFVKDAVPGDWVDVKIIKKKKKFIEGKVDKIITPSPNRIIPFCEHFGTCGGCKWQYLTYSQQLFYKQKQVEDCLQRIAKIEIDGIIQPIKPSARIQHYRNKLEYTFSSYRWLTDKDMENSSEELNMNALGFHIPGRFDKVLDIQNCYLQNAPSNDIRLFIKDYALKNKLTFFDIKKQTGFLRNIIIRTSLTGEVMVIVVFFYDDEVMMNSLLDELSNRFPEITSLMYVVNSKKNDIITDLKINCYNGNPYIIDMMGTLKYKIGPVSFFQTNSLQGYELYKIVAEYADLKGTEVVYDLYTGTGTIANFVAASALKVVGVEYVPEAINDAKENSFINNISNTSFYAGDMVKVLNDKFLEENGMPDVVITDPPRSGMHKDVIIQLLKMEAEKIIYVSCNPSTQARDIEMLKEKYIPVKVQPVDMFPHTQHVENVVLLTKK